MITIIASIYWGTPGTKQLLWIHYLQSSQQPCKVSIINTILRNEKKKKQLSDLPKAEQLAGGKAGVWIYVLSSSEIQSFFTDSGGLNLIALIQVQSPSTSHTAWHSE